MIPHKILIPLAKLIMAMCYEIMFQFLNSNMVFQHKIMVDSIYAIYLFIDTHVIYMLRHE